MLETLIKIRFSEMLFTVEISAWLVLLAVVGLAIVFLVRLAINRFSAVHYETIPVKIKYELGGGEVEYEITRNFTNVEIAYRMHVELMTRKAALPFDAERDIIVEVYDSWYALFAITRTELKSIPGTVLLNNKASTQVVKLLTDILNVGLRPHLTQFQGTFRKWYSEALAQDSNKGKSPQEIQKSFPAFEALVNSIKGVNKILADYNDQLRRVIEAS